MPLPLPKTARDMGSLIKSLLVKRAAELELPSELLMPNRLTKPLLRGWVEDGRFTLPDSLTGWRRDIIGVALVEQLNQLIHTEQGSE